MIWTGPGSYRLPAPAGSDGDRFGAAMGLGPHEAIVGAPFRISPHRTEVQLSTSATMTGSAGPMVTLTDPDAVRDHQFGTGLDLLDNALVIGVPGYDYNCFTQARQLWHYRRDGKERPWKFRRASLGAPNRAESSVSP